MHLILNFIVINYATLIKIGHDFPDSPEVRGHIVFYGIVQMKILCRIHFLRQILWIKLGIKKIFLFQIGYLLHHTNNTTLKSNAIEKPGAFFMGRQ